MDASKWVIITITVTPHLVILCAMQGILYTALAKRILDELVWGVLPSLVDPPADLIEFHLANTAAGSEGLLAGQHPRLPLLPHTIFKEHDHDCSIQGLQHTCHPFPPSPPPRNNNVSLFRKLLKYIVFEKIEIGS